MHADDIVALGGCLLAGTFVGSVVVAVLALAVVLVRLALGG